MKKPFALALFAYLVPTFILGYVWHLVVFHDTYLRLSIYRPDPIIPFGFGSMVLQGQVFAWAYPRLFDTARAAWVGSALRAGVGYAVLSWSFTTLAVAAKHPVASVSDFMQIQTAFTALQFVLVSPLMALAWRQRGA